MAALLVELGDLREGRSSDGAGRSVVPDFEASMAHVGGLARPARFGGALSLRRPATGDGEGSWGEGRSMGLSESLLTGTMEDGRRIAVWACGQIARNDLSWKSAE